MPQFSSPSLCSWQQKPFVECLGARCCQRFIRPTSAFSYGRIIGAISHLALGNTDGTLPDGKVPSVVKRAQIHRNGIHFSFLPWLNLPMFQPDLFNMEVAATPAAARERPVLDMPGILEQLTNVCKRPPI